MSLTLKLIPMIENVKIIKVHSNDEVVGITTGQLRAWHIWRTENEIYDYKFAVQTVEEAAELLKARLADQAGDVLVFNAVGMEMFDGEGWCEWYDVDGNSIGEVMDKDKTL